MHMPIGALRKASAYLLTAAVLLPGSLLSADLRANDSASQRQQLEDVQKQLRESQSRERDLAREAAQLTRKQQDLQRRLVQAARKLQAQEDLVSKSEEQLARLIQDEGEATKQLDARRAELSATLASLAKLSRQPPEAMVLAPGSALDMVRASQLIAALVPEIEQRAAALKQELERLSGLRRGIAQEQEKLGRAIAALDGERRDLEMLQAETAQAMAQTKEEREAERGRSVKLAEQAKDLRALLDRLLEQERREREAQARELARREAERRGGTAGTGSASGSGGGSGGGSAGRHPPQDYAALEGSGALPARGRVVGRYGESDENGAPLRGIRIETRSGGQVVAPADGKVMFAGPFKGYGQLLIIAHGGGYHSLLAGFGRIDRAVGQYVLAGEPVGLMATDTSEKSGTSGKPVLYLELRRRGDTVNPLPWLAAGDRKVSG